jgi:opacity protein-like surface antigen
VKNVFAASLLFALTLASSAAAADDSAPTVTRWELSAGGQVGIPSGWVKVGENDVRGTRLRFRKDLGIDTSEAFDLGAGYYFDSLNSLHLSLQSMFLDGSARLPRDVFFNGATLKGGTRLETRTNFPDFLRIGVDYGRYLGGLGERGTLWGTAGLTYVLLTFRVHGTFATSTRGRETKEDFLTQELPVPMLGLHGAYPLMDRLQGVFSVAGGYLPRIDSLRSEGGDVKLNQAHADLDLGMQYSVAPNVTVTAGYRYAYFFQLEKSREDDNVILLSDNALRLSFGYRF